MATIATVTFLIASFIIAGVLTLLSFGAGLLGVALEKAWPLGLVVVFQLLAALAGCLCTLSAILNIIVFIKA